MLAPWKLIVLYSCLVVGCSVLGGWITSAVRVTHNRLQVLVSFVGGLMLGVGILHQWPHAAALLMQTQPAIALNWTAGWMMAGILMMFYLLRTFHFHHHEPIDDAGAGGMPQAHEHDHDHGHHHHNHDHDHGRYPTPGIHGVSWIGVTIGLCLHTILDGVALASSVEADAVHPHLGGWLPAGFGTFLGIALHKPLDSLSITSLMLAGGWSAKWRHAINIGYGLMCPLGAILFLVGLKAIAGQEAMIASAALAFSAGVFVSIALSDLLPEVQFHSHDRRTLTAALFAGALLAWFLGYFEPQHMHGVP